MRSSIQVLSVSNRSPGRLMVPRMVRTNPNCVLLGTECSQKECKGKAVITLLKLGELLDKSVYILSVAWNSLEPLYRCLGESQTTHELESPVWPFVTSSLHEPEKQGLALVPHGLR